MTMTVEELHKIMSYICELSVKHHVEVQVLRRRIRDLECENGELQDALGRVEEEEKEKGKLKELMQN